MSRVFALVPAAGHSRRMQTPKLLLPVNGKPVIDHLLEALRPAVEETFILVRRDDHDLKKSLRAHDTLRIVEAAVPPPDMRNSVELLLHAVEGACSPADDDGWLLTPGDHPVVHPLVLRTVVDAFRRDPHAIHIPTFQGKGGHPTLFPWALASRVAELPPDQGLNSLRKLVEVRTAQHPTDEPSVLWDLDTPEDYARLVAAVEDRSR
jgi:molybdenum cofactor cytidylyltransferase